MSFLLVAVAAISQVRQKPIPKNASEQLRDFLHTANDADVTFTFPPGYRETSILNKQNYPFSYAIETTDHTFEVWLRVRSNKKAPGSQTADSDTSYLSEAYAVAKSMSEDEEFIIRDISEDVLANFNATTGRSYILPLPDQPETRHYKYALILSIQKNHTGSILAICFADETDTDFIKNVNHLSQYIRFKP